MSDWFDYLAGTADETEVWEPDFEPGRCLVRAKIGPWERWFLRPPRFRRRRYHRLYPLPVRRWRLNFDRALYDGLCQLRVGLTLRYQVTLAYVRRHPDAVAALDDHVRRTLAPLIADVVDTEVVALEAREWLGESPGATAQAIAMAVNETLTRHHLQCRALCRLRLRFAAEIPPEAGLLHERVCQEVHQRRLDAQQRQGEAAQALEEARLHHEQALWKMRQQAERERQAAEAEAQAEHWVRDFNHRAERQRREAALARERFEHETRLKQEAEARHEAEIAALRDAEGEEKSAPQGDADPLSGLSVQEKDQLLLSLEAYLGQRQSPLYSGELILRNGPLGDWRQSLRQWLSQWRHRLGRWFD